MISVGIKGIGYYVPERVITNDDFVEMGLDTSDEWITDRTGIKERRVISDDQACSDMAEKAGKKAIEDAGLEASDIDLLIVATTSPDYSVFPSTACVVQKKLGLRPVGAFDMSAACTGFAYALTVAAQFVKTKMYKNVLVIGSDCLSKHLDWTDRSICILFGDGAGAVVVSEVEEGYGVLASQMCSDGGAADLLINHGGGSKKPFSQEVLDNKEHYIQMDGKAVFKKAIVSFVPSLKKLLNEAGVTADDLDHYIPHQANKRIVDYACDKIGIDKAKVILNLAKYGNTSAASIPIAMAEAKEQGLFNKGDLMAISGFGAGFTWASSIIRWSY